MTKPIFFVILYPTSEDYAYAGDRDFRRHEQINSLPELFPAEGVSKKVEGQKPALAEEQIMWKLSAD